MDDMQFSSRGHYPPPPWRQTGKIWIALFHTATPVTLPEGLSPLFGRHTVIMMLIHYLEGALLYDELAFAVPARVGWHFGVYSPYIWVNNEASLHGGRQVWGLPKQMAEFTWTSRGVQIGDSAGTIVDLEISPASAQPSQSGFPELAFEGISRLNDQWAISKVQLSQMHMQKSDLRLVEYSSRLPYQFNAKPAFNSSIQPFTMLVQAPVCMGDPMANQWLDTESYNAPVFHNS